MGIATTRLITRELAVQVIMTKIHEMSDQDLAIMLETVVHNGFYNFLIASQQELEENKLRKYPIPFIESFNGIPDSNNAQ